VDTCLRREGHPRNLLHGCALGSRWRRTSGWRSRQDEPERYEPARRAEGSCGNQELHGLYGELQAQLEARQPRRASGPRHPARPCGGTAEHLGGAASLSAYTGPTERGICRTSHRVRPAPPFLTESACSPTFDTCSQCSWLGVPGCGWAGGSDHWRAAMPFAGLPTCSS